jgi:hypothetical protein
MKLSRSHLALVLVVASAAALFWALFGDSDEARILARIKELAAAVETQEGENFLFRRARLNKAFKAALEPNVALVAPELPTTTGIKEMAELASLAPNAFGHLGLSVGETDIRVEPEAHQARAVSRITLTGSQGGELRREARIVRFLLHESGGDWRVTSIDVDRRANDQPEARP